MIIIYCMSIVNSMEEYLRKIQSSRKDLFDKFMKYGQDNIFPDDYYQKNIKRLIKKEF